MEKDFDFYFNEGDKYDENGEFEKAIDSYNQAIAINPNQASVYSYRGLTYYNLKQYDKAIIDFDQAIALDPNDTFAYNNRGNSYSNLKQYDKAIDNYDQAIASDPLYAKAYYNRGDAFRHLKQYDKALIDYDRAIALEPDNATVYNNRGVVYENLNQHDKALLDYDKVISLEPNDSFVYINKGIVYHNLRQFEKAIANFEMAKKLNSIIFPNFDYYVKKINEELEEQKTLETLITNNIAKILAIKIKNEIENQIEKIIEASKSEVKAVVHYTKLDVAEIYVNEIKEKASEIDTLAKMNYSNAIYMNDPMEGKILFDYLDDNSINEFYQNAEKRTESNVYLGSFLPAEDPDNEVSHEDELVMWRTYGKDAKGKEACGCSIVLDSAFFEPVIIKGMNEEAQSIINQENPEQLLNVLYIRKTKTKNEIVNKKGAIVTAELKKLESSLKGIINISHKEKNDKLKIYIEDFVFKQLSQISFLFKSADYQYEHEVRVIKRMPKDSNEIKWRQNHEENAPKKRFFIESTNSVLPFIKKIYLGPKVEHQDQWSLYFDYEIRQSLKTRDNKPTVIKSDCKFQ